MAIKAPLKQNEFRHNIQESRQKFLDILCNSSRESEDNTHQNENFKKKPRKISFKVRRSSSTYRKNHLPNPHRTKISASTVAELASKFNDIIEKNNTKNYDSQFKKLVDKVGQSNKSNVITVKQTNTNSTSTMETHKKDAKPSIKKKPTIDNSSKVKIIRSKSSSVNVMSEIPEKRAEKEAMSNDTKQNTNTGLTIVKPPMDKSSKEQNFLGIVKAVVENFERNLKPELTKRSISEFNCAHNEETGNIEKNRRKSCKPDINLSVKVTNGPTFKETLNKRIDINEGKSILLDKQNRSEDMFDITTCLKVLANEDFEGVKKNIENRSSPYDLTRKNKMTNILEFDKREESDYTEDFQIESSRLYFEDSEDESLVDYNQENKIVEAINRCISAPCYSMGDIVTEASGMEYYKTINEREQTKQPIQPNTSFLWTKSASNFYQDLSNQGSTSNANSANPNNIRESNDTSIKTTASTLPKDFKNFSMKNNETIYEELDKASGYEPFDFNTEYELVEPKEEPKNDDSTYEVLQNENIYETLPSASVSRTASKNSGSYCTIKNEETISNCYESISNATGTHGVDNNYESIYFGASTSKRDDSEKDRGSITSSEQITNSLYGTSFYGASMKSWNDGMLYNNGSGISDLSFSDRSEWVDVSETEEDKNSKIIIIKEPPQKRRSGNWSQLCRKQWSKLPLENKEDENSKSVVQETKSVTDGDNKLDLKCEEIRKTKDLPKLVNRIFEESLESQEVNFYIGSDSDSDHLYETLRNSDDEEQDFCYDSFASDVETEDSFDNADGTINNGDLPLPSIPSSNDVLTRLAASASKHMRKFTKNLSMTRNDISKSLTRIKIRRKSKHDVNEVNDDNGNDNITGETGVTLSKAPTSPDLNTALRTNIEDNNDRNKNLSSNKGFLNRIRKSIIMTPEQATDITSRFHKSKSTFYLTSTIDIDGPDDAGEKKTEDDSGISLSPIERSSIRNSKTKLVRPQIPPPPTPIEVSNEDLKKAFKDKRSPSWYAETNLYRQPENKTKQKEKRPSACWYDEISLFQNNASTPSTSSAENSGTNTTSPNIMNEKENNETYYIMKNENNYYNESTQSLNSNGTKTDLSFNSLSGDDIQMRLQNEPLYQFYDAAVLESVCNYGASDMDSDNYEDIESRYKLERPSSRPSAMELIVPKRNSLAFTKTLWCEIPEVLQSSVLSTLSSHQKKLQEAKFEMVTSEASYLNSLNVLNNHFIQNLKIVMTEEEISVLFGKIEAVRQSSDKLLLDLEKCWQDNILLHGVCDIIQRHAEEDFSVYIPYCENHMLLDRMTKKLRERSIFSDTLKQLESSPICQSLSLYSFLMLPMQRITRWPLLLDAVLKRLEPIDPEYITCQYVLATINKIVSQCNEAARNKERELEMIDIESKIEFGKGVPPFELVIPNRWLVRSGIVVHMQPKSEEIKLTFGKRFNKTSLHLFLFNDLLVVAKPKSENQFSVIHYCSRNFTELSISDQLLSVPGKESAGKYLFLLTILENQNKKMVEFLLSCNSESDKQRWIEALSPLKSENPDEVLYECWDCPQVTVIHNYGAVQPDELSLVKGDIINVSRKMTDGWYQGERIRDGQTGWFPANYTAEIANPHVRARNLKQRYRLLTFSESYLRNK